MKNKFNIAVIFLIVLNIAMVGVCAYFYINMDKSSPKVTITNNGLVYYDGIDQALLMEGVSAVDKRDGDVSDRIVIEKILDNNNRDVVVVYYAVCDYAGNVTKAARELPVYRTETTE